MASTNAFDPFFDLNEDTHWNACVGPQGYDLNYVDGYLEAAILLADEVIKQERYIQRDTLAMPILYNARHSIELLLKHLIKKLVKSKIIGQAPPVSHDINAHWEVLAHTSFGDEMLTRLVKDLEPFVSSLASIDEDGQELRYSTNRKGNPSLEDRPLVNLQIICTNLFKLKDIVDRLKHRVESYIEERSSGTFTAYCSRQDLFAISDMLPLRANWNSVEFDVAKSHIRERFSLSNKQFEKALDVIQQHRELGSRIGIHSELLHLSKEKIGIICEQWTILHPSRQAIKELGIDYFDRSWQSDVRSYVEKSGPVYTTLLQQLSTADTADLETIFYIGRERVFCERYETMVTQAEHRISLGPSAPRESLHHIMSKTNLLVALARGLHILGCPLLSDYVKGLRPDLFRN